MPAYEKYLTKSFLDKAINALLGIVEGISMDNQINPLETKYLVEWLAEHEQYGTCHPFTEILPVVANAIHDGKVTPDEREEITWLCENLRSTEFHNEISADLQRLQAILGGIASDGIIGKDELSALADWIEEHQHLRSRWPFDEVDSLITITLSDGKIDAVEHQRLLDFFRDISGTTVTDPGPPPVYSPTVTGICASSPSISFDKSVFCFTGESPDYTRDELIDMVMDRGGLVNKSISQKVNYLVVGAGGNPCWKYACYGLKIEKAIQLRKKGHRIVIVHETDFHDALSD